MEIVRTVGRGSTGAVYEVRAASGEPLAFKVVADDTWAGLRRRESEVLQSLRHEHLVEVHGTARSEVGGGLLMEMLPGGSVEALVERDGVLTPGQAVTVLAPIAAALAYLHSEDVSHGDISPANVLFTASGMPKLTDFGLAGLLGRPGRPGRSAGYTAPELTNDPEASAGPLQDVYAWGAVAWYVLTGSPPGPTPTRPPLPSLVSGVEAGVAGLIEAALSEDARRRPSAAEAHVGIFDAGTPEPVDLVRSVDDIGLSRLVTQMPAALPGGAGPWAAFRIKRRASEQGLFRAGRPFRRRDLKRSQEKRGARPNRGRLLRRVALWSTAAVILMAALLAGSALVEDGPGTISPHGPEAASSDAARGAGSPPSEASPSAVPGTAEPVVTPEEAVVRLAEERDAALGAADSDRLDLVYAGEEAAARDREIIAQMAARDLRYAGLRTSLSGVRLVAREGRTATVEVLAAVGPYRVAPVDGGAAESVPAGEPVALIMDLQWEEEGGWKIAGVREGPLPES
ncbi:serine/threonine-protein kinase [Zhihengliuella alba]|uniref:serine/threonine-protein kinase n=1 Tax=Zhihengliuella alba TaxID=547018 RepID=UPI0031EA8267